MKFRRFAAAFLTAALSLSLCLPVSFAARYTAALRLEVQVQCTGTSIPAETLALELEGFEDAPMPEDTPVGGTAILDVPIEDGGTVTAVFPEMTFTRPGYYYYTLKQHRGISLLGTYDDTVYYLKVQVVNDGDALRTDVMAFTSPEMLEKKCAIKFINRFKSDPSTPCPTPGEIIPITPVAPVVTPEPETPVTPPDTDEPTVTPEPTPAEPTPPEEETPGGKLIQTGQFNWPIPVLTGSGIALMCIGFARIHREKRKDEDA